jgi:hypothetical protein
LEALLRKRKKVPCNFGRNTTSLCDLPFVQQCPGRFGCHSLSLTAILRCASRLVRQQAYDANRWTAAAEHLRDPSCQQRTLALLGHPEAVVNGRAVLGSSPQVSAKCKCSRLPERHRTSAPTVADDMADALVEVEVIHLERSDFTEPVSISNLMIALSRRDMRSLALQLSSSALSWVTSWTSIGCSATIGARAPSIGFVSISASRSST